MESRTPTETVAFDREALERIARDLDVVVASLDRIGSTYHDDEAAFRRALSDFVVNWHVIDRLARARHAVDDALYGPEGSVPESEELPDSAFWQPPS